MESRIDFLPSSLNINPDMHHRYIFYTLERITRPNVRSIFKHTLPNWIYKRRIIPHDTAKTCLISQSSRRKSILSGLLQHAPHSKSPLPFPQSRRKSGLYLSVATRANPSP